ncbi:MAG: hypothetical protein AB1696_04295 [Planctomycetota bacterium]
MRPARKRAIIILSLVAVLAVAQMGTWALFGRKTLGRVVPRIVEADAPPHRRYFHRHGHDFRLPPKDLKAMQEYDRDFREHLSELNQQGKLPTWNLIVPDSVAAEFGPAVLAKMRMALRDQNALVYTEAEAPAQHRQEAAAMPPNCSKLTYRVIENSPFIARIEVGYWTRPNGQSGGRHNLIWCLGFWIYLGPYERWIS